MTVHVKSLKRIAINLKSLFKNIRVYEGVLVKQKNNSEFSFDDKPLVNSDI